MSLRARCLAKRTIAASVPAAHAVEETAAATPEVQIAAGDRSGTGQPASVRQGVGDCEDRLAQGGPHRKQSPGRSDECGRDVAGQRSGRQFDPQAGLKRFHVVLHDDAVQPVARRRVDGFSDGVRAIVAGPRRWHAAGSSGPARRRGPLPSVVALDGGVDQIHTAVGVGLADRMPS